MSGCADKPLGRSRSLADTAAGSSQPGCRRQRDGVERGAELAGPVADEESEVVGPVAQLPDQDAGLLGGPWSIGAGGAEDVDVVRARESSPARRCVHRCASSQPHDLSSMAVGRWNAPESRLHLATSPQCALDATAPIRISHTAQFAAAAGASPAHSRRGQIQHFPRPPRADDLATRRAVLPRPNQRRHRRTARLPSVLSPALSPRTGQYHVPSPLSRHRPP